MDNQIRLSIESVFKGEGFTKANRAIKGMSNNIKDASGALSQLAGPLGAVSGKLGQVFGGLSKLSGAMAGGPWGLVIAGIGLVIGGLKKWRDHQKKLKEEHEELMRKMEEGYRKNLAGAIERARQKQVEFLESLVQKGQKAIETLNALRDAQNYSSKVYQDKNSQARQNELAMIDLDTANRSRGQSKEDQAVIKAENELKKIEIMSRDKLAKAHYEADLILKESGRLQASIEENEKIIETQAKLGKDTSKLENQLIKDRTKLLEQKNVYEIAQMKIGQIETQNAIDKARAEQELYDAQVASQKAESDERARQNKALFDAKKKIAEDEKKEAIENQKKQLVSEKERIQLIGEQQEQMLKKMIASGVGDHQFFRDAQRAQRFADREARDKDRIDPAQQKYDRLMERQRKGGKIGKRDQDFMRDFKNFKDAKDAPQRMEELTKQMKDKINKIDQKLKELGGK